MNRAELSLRLAVNGVNPVSYIIEGPGPLIGGTDSFYLAVAGSGWDVGYSERGRRERYEHFDDESAACSSFYRLVMRDFRPRHPTR